MIWIIIFAVVACVLLIVAEFLFTKPDLEALDEPIVMGVILTGVALVILLVCSRNLYVKGVRKGYPTSWKNIPSDQIYKFFGHIQGSKEIVVFLENAEGKIRCVTVPEAIDPNTEYVKIATFEEEITYKQKKKRLMPVSKE